MPTPTRQTQEVSSSHRWAAVDRAPPRAALLRLRTGSRAEPCCGGRSAPMLRSVLLLRALSRPRGWPGGGPLLRDAPGLLLGQGRPLWAAAPPGSRGLYWAGEWRHSGGEGSPQAGRSPREAGEEGRIKPRWESAGEEGGAGIRQCWQRNVLSFSR